MSVSLAFPPRRAAWAGPDRWWLRMLAASLGGGCLLGLALVWPEAGAPALRAGLAAAGAAYVLLAAACGCAWEAGRVADAPLWARRALAAAGWGGAVLLRLFGLALAALSLAALYAAAQASALGFTGVAMGYLAVSAAMMLIGCCAVTRRVRRGRTALGRVKAAAMAGKS